MSAPEERTHHGVSPREVRMTTAPLPDTHAARIEAQYGQPVVFGALARAEALAADDPDWMNCTRWPREASA